MPNPTCNKTRKEAIGSYWSKFSDFAKIQCNSDHKVSPVVLSGGAEGLGGGGLFGAWEWLLLVGGCGLGGADVLGRAGGYGLGRWGLGGADGFGGRAGATELGGSGGLLIGGGTLPLFDIIPVDTAEVR